MKKLLSLVCALALTLSCLTGALPGAAAEDTAPSVGTGTTYYVSNKGVGGNNGLSTDKPFPGLDAVDWDGLQPGDTVLLERGSTFDGFIHLVDLHGTSGNPIKVGAYGAVDAPKPVINGKGQGIWYQDYGQKLDNDDHKYRGYVSSTILLYDCDFIEISGLEITNAVPYAEESKRFQSGEAQTLGAGIMDRTGVAGAAKNGGIMEHIYLDDLYIHDVNGNIQDKHMDNGGIQLNALKPANENETGIARFDDVKITNCKVENVSRAGICVGYTYQWAKFNGSAIADATAKTYGHTNLYIANNYVKDAGNDAIVALYCYAPMVEKNIADHAGADLPMYQAGGWQRFCAGIWPWKCKDAIFQYNEVFNTEGVNNGDGQAYDVDWSDGTIYQYNYSHNNAMGPILFCASEAYNGVYRYNLSQDDLGCYMTLQGNPNAKIYNNVFYTGTGKNVRILHEAGSKNNGNAWIANNIFYSAEPKTVTAADWAGAGGTKTYTNNLYYNFSATPARETDAVIVPADQGSTIFVDPGKAPSATTTPGIISARAAFDGFKLAEGSPAIEKGILVENNGGKDFFGNELDNTPDIGMYNVFKNVVGVDNSIKTSAFEMREQNIYVPVTALSQTTVQDLLDGVTVARSAAKKVTDASDEEQGPTTVLADGMKLVITAENGMENTYTVAVKNKYDQIGDFVDQAQGNVWFAQYKQNGSYANFTKWTDGASEGKGWWGGVDPDYISAEKGALCGDVQAASSRKYQSSAFAFRAPVGGVVEISFPKQGAFVNQKSEKNEGKAYLMVTLNGEALVAKKWEIPAYGTSLTVSPFSVDVSAGDWVRFEIVNEGGRLAGHGVVELGPVVTYQESALEPDAFESDDYTINHESQTVTNVPYGTVKEDFLAKIICTGSIELKLVNETDTDEVVDGTAVVTGMRLEVIVNGADAVYYDIAVLPMTVKEYVDYDRTGWTATTGSEEPTAGGETEGPASYAIDGKLNTYWHSAYANTDASLVWIMLDMGTVQPVAQLTCAPRPGVAPNGRILEYKIEVSEDGELWTTVVEHGVWDTNQTYSDTKTASFDTCDARYVKLTGLKTGVAAGGDAEAGKKFGTAAEINIAYPVYE